MKRGVEMVTAKVRKTRERNQWKPTAGHFPKSEVLSLCGLENYYYLNYDAVRAYVMSLAHRRLRAALKKSGQNYLTWNEATDVCDTTLLATLRAHGKVETWKECPPWVVYVR
jgi:hypothetical protein